MIIHQILFYVFSIFAVTAGIMVITAKNPVQAVLFLVLTFFNMAAVWMLMESEFLSIVLVLVYVGAVMVLFLFVVMMLDIEAPQIKESFVKHWPIGLAVATVLLAMMVLVVDKQFNLNLVFAPQAAAPQYSDVKALGNLLYTNFLLPFEIAGVILLVAMVAAIGLTYRGPRGTKTQKPGLQIQVRKEDRLTIVQMKSEKGESS